MIACASLVGVAFINGEVMNGLLNLLLAGVIPGTKYSVPFWVMMAIYCTIIAMVITHYVERALTLRHAKQSAKSHKSRMPKRRYSHI
jgi:hypothetical protein